MTIKEINNLRKSGCLQEALTAAENEFAQNPNKYTAGTLFWCLYDLSKQQYGNDASDIFEQMISLDNDFCNGDEYMQKTIVAIKQRKLTHYQEVKDAVENAKKGANPLNIYRQVAIWHNEGSLDTQLYQDFGWLIYYTLKHTDPGDAKNRKILLHQYLQLDLPRPSILHSRILGETIKLEQNSPLQFRLRDFIRIWGLENLRDEDWEQFQTDGGNNLPSSVEKLIGVYAKELKTDGVESSEDFNELVDKALIKYPKNQNMPYFKATVLISQGKIQEALKYYKNLILQFPSKFYLWHQTAELIEDIDTKIGLLCKALTCGTDDEFLGGVRLKLASMLYQKGLRENAKYELDKYRETYQNKGWNLKPEFWQIYNQLTSIVSATNNKTIYNEYALNADEFIYSSLPSVIAIKLAESQNEDRNHPNRKITTWILRTKKNIIRLRKPTKLGLNRRTPNGTIFDAKLKDGKIVWIKPHIGIISEPWLKKVSGEVRLRKDRNGKKYTIISGSYVGENLLTRIDDGQRINILSVQQKDGRWTAVTILKS